MQVMGHHITARDAIGLLFSESNSDNADLSRQELEARHNACLLVQQRRDMMRCWPSWRRASDWIMQAESV